MPTPPRPLVSEEERTELEVRPARDNDAGGLIALVGACFADYPGCVLAVDAEMPHLKAIDTAFARLRGRAWVAERQGGVAGVIAVKPAAAPRTMELTTLYVGHAARRQGLGGRLVGLVEDEARERRAQWVELWTDTRFTDAHRLYERLGYHRLPETRELEDLSDTIEYHYVKPLEG